MRVLVHKKVFCEKNLEMSPNSIMGDELQFQQRWEYRRKDDDFDSSSDDLKSSSTGEPVLKKHKLVTGLILPDNYETSNACTLQENHNCSLGFGDQTEIAKAKEKKITRGKKFSFAGSQMKRDCQEEEDAKKSRTFVYDPATLDDVENFRESLLEDIKATGENLFTWMREEMKKLAAADDITPKRGRRKRTSRGKEVQLRYQTSRNKKKQMQKHVNFEKNVPQNNIEENFREQHLNNNGAVVHMQQQNNFEKDAEVQHQNNLERNIQVQHQNNFKLGKVAKKCNEGSSERLAKRVKEANNINHSHPLGHQVDHGRAIRKVASEKKGERPALNVNSNLLAGPSNENVQLQHPKSIVLAIRAQNCKDGFSERCIRRKKTGDPNKYYRVQKDRVGFNQAIGSPKSTEKNKAEGLELSVQKRSPPNPADQAASSMYLTLPTVLSKPHDSNNWLDTFLSSYMQPRVSGYKTSENLETVKQMHDSSTHFGYIPNIQPEESTANFAQIGSPSMSCFEQNGTQTSSTVTGFPFPLHQGTDSAFSIPSQFTFENIPPQNGNILGLQMNAGATTVSEGSYALSGNLVANNLLNHSNYKGDSRLMPHQIPSITDGFGFPN